MRRCLMVALLLAAPGVGALTSEAKEFLEISKQLEPVQCEKRRLRREIVFAEAENRSEDARALKKRFAAIDKDPKTVKLEKRLAQLNQRLLDASGKARHPEDLDAISFRHREAFYRCE